MLRGNLPLMHIYISLGQICRRISRFRKTWIYNLDPGGLHISWNVAGSTFVIILVWYYLSHSWEGTCEVRLLFRGIQNCSSYPAPSEAYLWRIFESQYSKVGWQYRDPETQSSSWGNHYAPRKGELKYLLLLLKFIWKLCESFWHRTQSQMVCKGFKHHDLGHGRHFGFISLKSHNGRKPKIARLEPKMQQS